MAGSFQPLPNLAIILPAGTFCLMGAGHSWYAGIIFWYCMLGYGFLFILLHCWWRGEFKQTYVHDTSIWFMEHSLCVGCCGSIIHVLNFFSVDLRNWNKSVLIAEEEAGGLEESTSKQNGSIFNHPRHVVKFKWPIHPLSCSWPSMRTHIYKPE